MSLRRGIFQYDEPPHFLRIALPSAPCLLSHSSEPCINSSLQQLNIAIESDSTPFSAPLAIACMPSPRYDIADALYRYRHNAAQEPSPCTGQYCASASLVCCSSLDTRRRPTQGGRRSEFMGILRRCGGTRAVGRGICWADNRVSEEEKFVGLCGILSSTWPLIFALELDKLERQKRLVAYQQI